MKNENLSGNSNEARQLLFHGGLMILLSLLTGFTVYFALAPRIALSSHTVGLLQGAILIAIAGAWHLLNASSAYLKIIKYTLLIGFYANWLGYQLAGLWSAGRSHFPIYGKDMPEGAAAPWQDLIVTILGYFSGLILVSAVLIAWAAFNGNRKETKG
jgi:(hydroxyamino)benzene mutase